MCTLYKQGIETHLVSEFWRVLAFAALKGQTITKYFQAREGKWKRVFFFQILWPLKLRKVPKYYYLGPMCNRVQQQRRPRRPNDNGDYYDGDVLHAGHPKFYSSLHCWVCPSDPVLKQEHKVLIRLKLKHNKVSFKTLPSFKAERKGKIPALFSDLLSLRSIASLIGKEPDPKLFCPFNQESIIINQSTYSFEHSSLYIYRSI